MFKKYYIESKFRFTMFVTIMLLIIIMSISALFSRVYADGTGRTAYYAVTVEAGDSLWTIAARCSDGNKDIRKLIYDISKVNDLNGSEIYEGQKLLIPA